MKNLRFFLIVLFLSLSGCAHIRQSCDDYCTLRGGQCSHIEQGQTRYNTVTRDTEERPTVFVCRYNW